MTNERAKIYQVGDRVRVTKPGLRENGVPGEVIGYDPEAQWYVVALDSGPPFYGRYEAGELTPA